MHTSSHALIPSAYPALSFILLPLKKTIQQETSQLANILLIVEIDNIHRHVPRFIYLKARAVGLLSCIHQDLQIHPFPYLSNQIHRWLCIKLPHRLNYALYARYRVGKAETRKFHENAGPLIKAAINIARGTVSCYGYFSEQPRHN